MDSVLGDYDIATQMNASFYDYRFYNTAKTISEINEIKNYISKLIIFFKIYYNNIIDFNFIQKIVWKMNIVFWM